MSERIVVVGGGSMGAGIARVACDAGYEVLLVEPDMAAAERAAARAPDARVVADVPFDDAAVLAIEAIPERLDLKVRVFSALEQRLPNAVLATNTSSLSVAQIARAVSDPTRVLGLHFFNPPEKMRLVEVARTTSTRDETIHAARVFVERLGKSSILTADTPGFVVNRVARPFYLQSIRALEAGVADAPHLDALARGIGFRMGPFELMDFIGVDVNLATTESIYDRTQQERLAPLTLQRALVEAGHLGRKTRRGFYSYGGETPRIDLHATPAESAGTAQRVIVLGASRVGDEIAGAIERHFAPVLRLRDDEVPREARDVTIAIDVGDGERDRSNVIERLDSLLAPECVLVADAYASDLGAVTKLLQHPQRLVGFGVVGSFENQGGVEIVASYADRSASESVCTLFESTGHGVVETADVAGLFLGRTIGSVVNEAVTIVEEGIASAGDVDRAMRLGTNYPRGPLEWGREIGGRRIARILERLAEREGKGFLPHPALTDT